MKSIFKIFLASITAIFFIYLIIPVQAANDFSKHLKFSEIYKGTTIGSLDNNFHISFPGNTYTKAIDVYISESTVPDFPKGVVISKIYSYYILTKEVPANEFEIALRFAASSDSVLAKYLWSFDYKTKQWKKLLTKIDWAGKLAIAKTTNHYGKIVLLEQESVIYQEPVNSYLSFDNQFEIVIPERVDFNELEIKSFNTVLYPEQQARVSDIYQYDMKIADIMKDPIELVFEYEIKDFKMPTALFWDKTTELWKSLPTLADLDKQQIRVQTVLPFSRVALFMIPDRWVGEASWYKYKNCNCAASRDYAKGTILKVTHLGSAKFINVKVNDYGPELWTGRIIDLDATVFKQFGSLRWGVTDVKIELVQ